MIRIHLNINIKYPQWFNRLFRCKHERVSVEENPYSRYGWKTSYSYCMKCGRKAGEISANCTHEEDLFGLCRYCGKGMSKFKCKHEWTREPDTDDYFCEHCGKWKDEI